MFYGVKIAVTKGEVEEHGEFLWNLVEEYDTTLRSRGIDFIDWTIVDLGDVFVVAAMLPGDFRKELLAVKQAVKAGIAQLSSGGFALEAVEPSDQ